MIRMRFSVGDPDGVAASGGGSGASGGGGVLTPALSVAGRPEACVPLRPSGLASPRGVLRELVERVTRPPPGARLDSGTDEPTLAGVKALCSRASRSAL